jgi:hypothetical protein
VVQDCSHVDPNSNSTVAILWLPGLVPLDTTNRFPSSVIEIARNVRALLIGIEHRFIGHSTPFSLLTPDTLYFCTPDQALADFAQVISSIPNLSQLIAIGGNLATWLKIKFPQLVDAAWASSAAVQVVGAFPLFDANLLSILDRISPKCRDATAVVMHEIDAAFSHGDDGSRERIRSYFDIPNSVSNALRNRRILRPHGRVREQRRSPFDAVL